MTNLNLTCSFYWRQVEVQRWNLMSLLRGLFEWQLLGRRECAVQVSRSKQRFLFSLFRDCSPKKSDWHFGWYRAVIVHRHWILGKSSNLQFLTVLKNMFWWEGWGSLYFAHCMRVQKALHSVGVQILDFSFVPVGLARGQGGWFAEPRGCLSGAKLEPRHLWASPLSRLAT